MRTAYANGDEITLAHNGCDGCTPASVNEHFCHEHGCPDAWRDRTRECFECGCDFRPSEQWLRTCDDCNGENDDDE